MHPDAEPVQQSLLLWLYISLGPIYALLLPLAGFGSFLLALLLALRGKGPLAGASLILAVHVPLLVGVFGAFHGVIASYLVVAQSEAAPRPSAIAEGVSMALVAPLVGMLLMVPGYGVAIFGAVFRSLVPSQEHPAPKV